MLGLIYTIVKVNNNFNKIVVWKVVLILKQKNAQIFQEYLLQVNLQVKS